MTEVRFYDTVAEEKLKFAVIGAKYRGRWVFCKHRRRSTWEIPGGRREPGEDILETARRELYEETGAVRFDLRPVCVYSVLGKTIAPESSEKEETFGMLYFASIHELEGEPELSEGLPAYVEQHSEIEKIMITDELPEDWTYPEIQPKLLEQLRKTDPASP